RAAWNPGHVSRRRNRRRRRVGPRHVYNRTFAFAHVRLHRFSSSRFREHRVPIALHADDGDAVIHRSIESLSQGTQTKIAIISELSLGVVVMKQKREMRTRS